MRLGLKLLPHVVTLILTIDEEGELKLHIEGVIKQVGGHTMPISLLTDIKYLQEGCWKRFEKGDMIEEVCK